MKIILIVTYFGQWPIWFPCFFQSCNYNPTINWIFFTDCRQPIDFPSNLRFIPFTVNDFNSLASKKIGFNVQLSKPIKLCDFRPLYGLIFQDYLKDYDFWGHCDIDVVWGDIRKFITDDILTNYDVISSRKNFIAGHFTLYKKNHVNKRLLLDHSDKISHPWYSEYGNIKDILQSEKHLGVDELAMTDIIRKLERCGNLNVYWQKYLLNFSNPINNAPGKLGELTNNWYWKKGKLYEQTEGTEVMYLHFMTWKDTLKKCYFDYSDDPDSFYISYSHIGLTKDDKPPLESLLIVYKRRAKERLMSLKKYILEFFR